MALGTSDHAVEETHDLCWHARPVYPSKHSHKPSFPHRPFWLQRSGHWARARARSIRERIVVDACRCRPAPGCEAALPLEDASPRERQVLGRSAASDGSDGTPRELWRRVTASRRRSAPLRQPKVRCLLVSYMPLARWAFSFCAAVDLSAKNCGATTAYGFQVLTDPRTSIPASIRAREPRQRAAPP